MIKKYTLVILILETLISPDLFAQYNINTNKKLLADNIEELEIKVYPNPVKSGEYVTIEFKNFNKEKPILISIINVIGKRLLTTTVDTASLKLQILKNKYPAGIYILKVKQDNKIRTLRLNIIR